MKKTVCELFAGVGGFRCGLNNITKINNTYNETWQTVWFNQWEPNKKSQWAHDCYVEKFGTSFDNAGNDTTNIDIEKVDKTLIPDHNLLVGGFPCQDYSVARSLSGEKGIEGKKGVLWWSIEDTIAKKHPPFILLENVDRLLKSPSTQRGRDFGIMLGCLNKHDYIVEWRVINAAEYGYVQKRRRVFIFAYQKNTIFASKIKQLLFKHKTDIIHTEGFFAHTFPIKKISDSMIKSITLPEDVFEISDSFKFDFQNSGFMIDGKIYTSKTIPTKYKPATLGSILEDCADKKYYIPIKNIYYTSPEITHSDERENELTKESRQTWKYIKGAKKRLRYKDEHEYVYSEGAIPLIDEWDTPARTMLTSEGTFNRSTHIVRDKTTNKIRILTPVETERIQGFPDNWTQHCLVDGKVVEMPERTRYFCMGNALVVPLISRMERYLSKIFEEE